MTLSGEMAEPSGFGSAGGDGDADLDRRFSRAFMAFNSDAHEDVCTGTLIQVWRPKKGPDGKVHLETKDLPVSIYGMGDMLAQFRYLSCARQFSPDAPDKMGVVGRVFASGTAEFCGDLQAFRPPAYLRDKEAADCDLHSMLAVPVYARGGTEALAVVELLWHERDVPFAPAITRLQSCFQMVELRTAEVDVSDITMGLNMASLGGQMP